MFTEGSYHFFQLLRYGAAFVFLMLLFPKLLFWNTGGSLLERIAARFMLMTVTLIVMGYLLVATKVYELLAILAVLLLLAIRAVSKEVQVRKRRAASQKTMALLYDWLENKYNPWPDLMAWTRNKSQETIELLQGVWKDKKAVIELSVLVFVLLIAGYIRFYDAIMYAAPAMSDGYVTLAWMKYIDGRVLFHDGIYPHGFHIWLDFLYKFAFIDGLHILKYTGPLNSILLMIGMYLVVSRWTGSRVSGIIAVAVYGLLHMYISGSSYERQVATNSQEFAFIFIFPTLYFIHLWLRNRYKWALTAGIVGMIATGLIHTLAYAMLGMGICLLLVIYAPLTFREALRPLWPVIVGGIASVVIAATPIGLGLLFGSEFHSASEEFATSRNKINTLQELSLVEYITIAACSIVLLWCLWNIRRIRQHTDLLFIGLFTVLLFVIYYFANLMSFPGSTVITARSSELWALIIPVCIGVCIGTIFRLFPAKGRFKYVETIAIVIILSVTVYIVPPEPIVPYKMEWDSGVDQYLRINSEFRPKTWTIVNHAREGYALVLGNGNHQDVSEFLINYYPDYFPLQRVDKKESGLPEHIFIYIQKKVFKVSEGSSIYTLLEPEYEKREDEMKQLEGWIERHAQVNPELSVWYEDDVLIIYHIYQPMPKEEVRKVLFGEEAAP